MYNNLMIDSLNCDRVMQNFIAWVSYTQEIRMWFSSHVTSLNRIFVSKLFLAIFVLLFIHSLGVASNFCVSRDKHTDLSLSSFFF